jgi:hypothetical protein
MKPPARHRARLTSNPMLVRATGHSGRSKRLRDLFEAFAAKLKPDDVIGRAAALRAAELVAMAEDIRETIRAVDLTKANADLLKHLASLVEEAVRIENLSDRASRHLRQLTQDAPQGPSLADVWEPYTGKERPYQDEGKVTP